MTPKTPPKSLSGEGRRVWRRMNEMFEFELAELVLLRTALESWDMMNTAREALARDGFTVAGAQGGEKSHPALRAYHVGRCGFLESWKALNLNAEPAREVGRPADAFLRMEVNR